MGQQRSGPAGMSGRALTIAVLGALVLGGLAAPAGGDQGYPFTLSVKVPVVVPLGEPVHATVSVNGAAGAPGAPTSAVRLRVRVAHTCAATFAATVGATTYDAALAPQPAAGSAYHASVRIHVTPHEFGYRTICAYLEQASDARELAAHTNAVIVITHECTTAVHRRESALRRLASARHLLRHAHGAAYRKLLTRRVAGLRTAAKRASRIASKTCRPADVSDTP